MPGVDQILSVVVQQGANELRLGTDQTPVVLARGVPRRFTMSPTPDSVLRQLLGELLTAERVAELERTGRASFEHHAPNIGRFRVMLTAQAAGGFEATLVLAGTGDAVLAERLPKPEPTPATAVSGVSRPATAVSRASRLNELLERALAANASDVHLADGEPPYFRVDGRLERAPHAVHGAVEDFFELDERARADIASGRALDLGLELGERQRLRVSLYRIGAGLAAAIRVLPGLAPTLEQLKLPQPLEDLADVPHGLVLVAGATGSGKSTTLAALCRRALEHRSVLLVTLEDPIEFTLPAFAHSIVRQRQIGRDVPDFSTGLRDALRSDPDVIMVGELRDAETIRLALTAAETGHLVLASLHSGSAAGSVERVIDAYPAEQRAPIRTQLAEALRAVVVQRLLPRARGTGRVVALEVLRGTHAVANVIREGKTAQIGTLLQGGARDGMLSLERCLASHVQSGLITLEQARASANEPDSLAMYLAK
jgi:twitching motility protein PilT